jgi:hypothetical protein
MTRDDLVKFLRPFAQEGKEVREEDVRTFFAEIEGGQERVMKSGMAVVTLLV